MENHIPQLIAGFVASGGSYWLLRSKLAWGFAKRTYTEIDNGNWRVKKDLADAEINNNRRIERDNQRIDLAKDAEELREIGEQMQYDHKLHMEKLQAINHSSNVLTEKLSKRFDYLRFIKYKTPLFLAIASLGLASYEAIIGNSDLAMGAFAFAIPHLFEVLANKNTGITGK